MPGAPLSVPVVVLVPAQLFVSGYLSRKNLSIWFLLSCAVAEGLDAPLPIAIDPSPFGLVMETLWSSLLCTVQPGGRIRVSPLLATVLPEVVVGVGVVPGLGVPAGLGL